MPEAKKRPVMFMDDSQRSVATDAGDVDRVPATLDDMDRNDVGAEEADDIVKATPVEREPIQKEVSQ